MKKIILFLFPFFLFAWDYNICRLDSNSYDFVCFNILNNVSVSKSNSNKCTYLYTNPLTIYNSDGYAYDASIFFLNSSNNPDNINFYCFRHYLSLQKTWGGCNDYHFVSSYYDYCKNRPGYIFSTVDWIWFPSSSDTNATPICPDGERFDPNLEKCIKKPDLSKLQQQCDTYCGGSQFVKYFQADTNGSNVVCKCYTCSDIATLVSNYCKSHGYKVKNFQCSGDGSHISKTNYSGSPSLSDCDVPHCSSSQHLQVNQDGYKVCVNDSNSSKLSGSDHNSSGISNQQQCLNSGGNWLCQGDQCQCVFSNGSGSSGSGSTGSASNGSSSNSSGGSSSNSSGSTGSASSGSSSNSSGSTGSASSKSKVNCCDRFHNQQLGDRWVQVSSTEWDQKNSPYCKVSIVDGKCSDLSSGSNNSNSSGSDNSLNSSLLSGISSKISDTNSKLNNINNNLKDIINLKPDKTPSGQLDQKTQSFISGFSKTISNIKNSIESLKNSSEKVLSLLENPSKVTLFSNSDVQTCPVNFTIYNQTKTFDICREVSPYRPFIQLIFTLFFSISVLLYFFDVFIRSK